MTTENSRPRKCDHTCHNAKRRDCECFCGGLFHGSKGTDARLELKAEMGLSQFFAMLSSEDEFFTKATTMWVQRVDKARAENPRFKYTSMNVEQMMDDFDDQ